MEKKIEPKETPRCLIPRLIFVFTRQLETTLTFVIHEFLSKETSVGVLNYAKKVISEKKLKNKLHSPKHRKLRETTEYQLTLFSKNQGRIQLVLRWSTWWSLINNKNASENFFGYLGD